MARKFLVSIDHTNLESLNFKFQNLTADPSSGVGAGSAYFNTVGGKLKVHNGTGYVEPTDRAQHTGTQLASTISDLAATVKAYRLDEFAAPTADINFNSRKLTGVAPGTLGTDAVNKNQLDALQNGTDWKDSVRAGTTANITLSGLQVIDTVSLLAGQRVLVKNQTTQSENGIYIAGTGAWVRSDDAVQGKITPATSVMIEEGDDLKSTQWRVTATGTITVGTSPITWTQIGAGTTNASGIGIDIQGNVINIDTSIVPRKYASTIGNGSATSIAVTHNLGSSDIAYSIRQTSDNSIVDCDVTVTSTNVVTFGFAVAPANNSLRVVILA